MLKWTCVLVVLGFAVPPPSAYADPVRISSGVVHIELGPFIDFRLSAPGFDVAGQGFEDIGLGVALRDSGPLRTGAEADLSADVLLRAAALVGRSTDFVLIDGTLHFTSKDVPIRFCDTETSFTTCGAGPAPFTLAGVLNVFDTHDRFDFSKHIVGRGFATGTIDDFTHNNTPGVGRPVALDFTFGGTPTPEPTSLLLVGLAATAVRVRRYRRGAPS